MKCSWKKLVDEYLGYKHKLGFDLGGDATRFYLTSLSLPSSLVRKDT